MADFQTSFGKIGQNVKKRRLRLPARQCRGPNHLAESQTMAGIGPIFIKIGTKSRFYSKIGIFQFIWPRAKEWVWKSPNFGENPTESGISHLRSLGASQIPGQNRQNVTKSSKCQKSVKKNR